MGNVVTWQSKRKTVVARSSAEAEYRAMTHGVCKVMFIKCLLEGLKIECVTLIQLYCDNQSTRLILHTTLYIMTKLNISK